MSFGTNFLPGPTDIHPDVLAAQAQPMFSHRSPRMRRLLEEVEPGLQECFGTRQPVFFQTCSGTGLLEVAMRNGVRRRVLVVVGGYFGEYSARIAEGCGKEVVRLHVHPGSAITPEQLEEFLDGPPVDAVLVVHSESATGALADIPALAEVVHRRDDVLLLVDGVTSVGAMPIAMDRSGADYCCTGSQKALALPPGLAFGVASEAFRARAERQDDAGYYFSARRLISIARDHMPWWTPAVSLLLSLECQMRRIQQNGGWAARWARHASMRQMVDQWIASREELRLMTPEGVARSPAISSVMLPGRFRATRVIDELERRGFLVGGALDPRYGEIVRIGHMGDLEPVHLERLLSEIETILQEMDRLPENPR